MPPGPDAFRYSCSNNTHTERTDIYSNNRYKERNQRFNCIPKCDGSCAHIPDSGILCGKCQPGLSLALGTSKCLKCSNAYLLVFLLVGLVLVVLLSWCFEYESWILLFAGNTAFFCALMLYAGSHAYIEHSANQNSTKLGI